MRGKICLLKTLQTVMVDITVCLYRAGNAVGLAHREQECQKEETGKWDTEEERSATMLRKGEIQLHRPVPPEWRWKGTVKGVLQTLCLKLLSFDKPYFVNLLACVYFPDHTLMSSGSSVYFFSLLSLGQVVICSYFAHHLNVFSVISQEHLHTLEDCWSLLDLRTAALTHSGSHLVISNYSEAQQSPYLTLWDTQHGRVCWI